MRLYRIDQMLQEEGSVSFEKLQAALQCSAPTLKRDIRYMREAVGAPIVYSRAQNTYSYERGKEPARKNRHAPELPSPWFTPGEMYSFMAILQLLDRIEGDPAAVLGDDIPALKSRILAMLPADMIGAKELMKRVKVVMPPVPTVQAPFFNLVGSALAQRRRLRLTYYTRTRGVENARQVSPLRLVNWRGRWYLDAWCHETEKLKTFAVENIRFAEMLSVRGDARHRADARQYLWNFLGRRTEDGGDSNRQRDDALRELCRLAQQSKDDEVRRRYHALGSALR